jgi:single-stranded DNA-binding protein
VCGEMQARNYEDKQGKARMSLDVAADEVEFLSPKEEKSAQQYEQEYVDSGFKDISSDDIPF